MLQLLYFPLYLFYAAAFLLLINRIVFFDIAGVKKKHLSLFFILKVAGGLMLTLVYTYYYTDPAKADIYRYFNDSTIISSLLFSNPQAWLKVMFSFRSIDAGTLSYIHNTMYVSHPGGDFITNNTFLIKVIALLNYFSFYNIYIDTLLLNCLTFIALTALLKVLIPYFKTFPQILYWPLFLIPSVVFWSSGLLKEGVIFIGISLYLSQWLRYDVNQLGQKPLISALGFLVVGITKMYVALVLFACSIFLPVRNDRNPKLILISRLVIGLAICLLAWYSSSNYPLCRVIADKRNEFITLSIAEHSNSAIDTNIITASYTDLIKLTPSAIINVALRPFLWDKGKFMQTLFALENTTFLLSIISLLLFYFRKPQGDNSWLAAFCFMFAGLNYLGIGITVPVLGAIVHYRVVAMPFLLLSVLLMADLEKLKKHFAQLSSRIKS